MKHGEVTSDHISPEDRVLRARMIHKLLEFCDHIVDTVADKKWIGRKHPFIKRGDMGGMNDYIVDLKIKVQRVRNPLTSELKVIDSAMDQDRKDEDA